MEYEKKPRASWPMLQQLIEWSECIMGASGATCLSSRHSGQPGGCQKHCRDVCCPIYQPTHIPGLELQRQNMALALVGQLTVVTFRVLTGHFGGSAVGLIIFAVGNNARCSLQSANLSGYVILGGTFGLLDSWDLLQTVAKLGLTGFFGLPFEECLAQDLTALAMVLAPVVEIMGARIAWDSYLSPSMVFQATSPQLEPFGSPASGWQTPASGRAAAYMRPQMYYQPQHYPPHHEGWYHDRYYLQQTPPPTPPSGSWFAGYPTPSMVRNRLGAALADLQEVTAFGAGENGEEAVDDRSLHAEPAPGSSADPPPYMERCADCGGGVRSAGGSRGSGRFAGHVYCDRCWAAWCSNS